MSAEPTGPLIVIDGPAGAGKTTVARAIARELGCSLLDTGAIYRCLALEAKAQGVGWDDELALGQMAVGLRVEFQADPAGGAQRVLCGGKEVTTDIRQPEISQGASKVSAWPAVRSALLGLQRGAAERAVREGGCVAEGRDMGTVVFPDADHKFFLTAESAARAQRRQLELEVRGAQPLPTVGEVEKELRARDERDSSRAAAPLRQAEDALLVDSSELSIEEVVSTVLRRVREG